MERKIVRWIEKREKISSLAISPDIIIHTKTISNRITMGKCIGDVVVTRNFSTFLLYFTSVLATSFPSLHTPVRFSMLLTCIKNDKLNLSNTIKLFFLTSASTSALSKRGKNEQNKVLKT